MSTRGHERGTRGRGRDRGTKAGSSTSGYMPDREAPASPVTETGSHDRAGRDDALSQAMLRVLERVAGATSNVTEYWLESIERIIDYLDCMVEQKLKGVVSLLRDEAYQ
ncbi:Fructose-1,6-bisphosphatase class 1 [Gossypium australe]|uniref:Fructose-1,6-bisphosphatase class 1 n=1 Tax=Gossypium australe TaxID=47621 RepID=A0A5B6VNI5_9ROSI|nr:Fructose-1,6-bisphosphatase class 1 [Gossypium australe]